MNRCINSCTKKDKSLTKQDVYKKAIEINFIDQQGNPTKWALEQGYIKEMPTVEEPTSDKDLDNVFSRMPNSAFKWVESEGQYAMDQQELEKAILSALKDGSLSPVGRKHWLGFLADINTRKD